MKTVMISGPYTGENAWEVEKNVRTCEQVALDVALMGAVPVCLNVMGRFWDGVLPYDMCVDMGMALARHCDALLVVQLSGGVKAEIEAAKRANTPVFYTLEGLKWWLESVVNNSRNQ